ncbi:hypothetical protein HZS_1176 [Henneguya salminicola]|nr:hypothetical protein HZS_1176 [Henneguya salminicola]
MPEIISKMPTHSFRKKYKRGLKHITFKNYIYLKIREEIRAMNINYIQAVKVALLRSKKNE